MPKPRGRPPKRKHADHDDDEVIPSRVTRSKEHKETQRQQIGFDELVSENAASELPPPPTPQKAPDFDSLVQSHNASDADLSHDPLSVPPPSVGPPSVADASDVGNFTLPSVGPPSVGPPSVAPPTPALHDDHHLADDLSRLEDDNNLPHTDMDHDDGAIDHLDYDQVSEFKMNLNKYDQFIVIRTK